MFSDQHSLVAGMFNALSCMAVLIETFCIIITKCVLLQFILAMSYADIGGERIEENGGGGGAYLLYSSHCEVPQRMK